MGFTEPGGKRRSAVRSDPLVGVATALTGDFHDAEDLVQDTMVKAFLHWRRVSRLDRPGGWCQPLEATAPGGLASFINLQNQIVAESVAIYPSKDAASSVMDSMEAPGFKDCFFAAFDAENGRGFPGSDPTTTSFDIAAPAAHGDRQIAFGQETRTGNDSRTRLYHDIWIQVGRSIILIIVSPDGLGSDNPAGLTEKSIATAIASLKAALPGG